jgi:glycosyltransferase involved in cell wall biosynthesis
LSTLILSPFFFPEPISSGRYNTVLAQRLAARGEQVIVFASHPLYPAWRPERSTASLPNISIQRGGAWLHYPQTPFLRRFVLETWYSVFACLAYFRLANKPQRVVAVLPPGLYLLFLRAFLPKQTTVVGIVHDIQAVLGVKGRSIARRLLRACVTWIEHRSFTRCDRLVFLSQSMAERAIREYGLLGENCSVHYPFPTLAERAGERSTALERILPPGRINIVYSGALGQKQSPDELIRFMAELSHRNPAVSCHIFSAGPHYERLKHAWSFVPDYGVNFHPLVPDSQLAELYACSAVHLIPQADGTSDGALPSKLPNLLTAGVPIFAICEPSSEVDRILTDAGAGITASSFFGEDAMRRFDMLLSGIATETRSSRVKRLRPFVERYFDVDQLIDEILESVA